MRTLLLLRHGKAVGSDPRGDHDRPLNEIGRQQAAVVGTMLARLGLVPEVSLVSDAVRTRQTAKLALAGLDGSVRLEPDLYQASPEGIISIVKRAAGSATRIMVVGHNPGIGQAARMLQGAGDPQAIIGLQQSFPTAALAVLDFTEHSWGAMESGSATLSRFIVPGAIPGA